jgi:hypothetical protein
MAIIASFESHTKEFAAVAKEFKEVKEKLDSIQDLIEGKSIKSNYLLSAILEKESITQDKFDELLAVIKSYGKQRGFKTD